MMYSTLAASELNLNGAFFDLMVLYDQRHASVDLAEMISLKEVRRGKREQEKITGKKGWEAGKGGESGGPKTSMQSSGRLKWPMVRPILISLY